MSDEETVEPRASLSSPSERMLVWMDDRGIHMALIPLRPGDSDRIRFSARTIADRAQFIDTFNPLGALYLGHALVNAAITALAGGVNAENPVGSPHPFALEARHILWGYPFNESGWDEAHEEDRFTLNPTADAELDDILKGMDKEPDAHSD